MRLCPDCGHYSDDSNKFCPRCGRAFDDTEYMTISESQYQPYYVKKSHKYRWIAVAIVLVILFSAIATAIDDRNSNDMHKEWSWTVYGMEPPGESHVFSISFDIDENDLNSALKSPMNRDGSRSKVRTGDLYPVTAYAVDGTTIHMLCQKLWTEYSNFVQLYPVHNNSIDFVNYIMAFVQNVMDYESDDVQFGHNEYWQFPVETLFHEQGDCEDGALLLATIFKEMSNLNEIGDKEFAPGDYISDSAVFLLPEHAMAGICFKTPTTITDGYYVTESGKQYWFCETTGLGWYVGDLSNKLAYASLFVVEYTDVYL